MPLNELEELLVASVTRESPQLVRLVKTLIAYDTTAREPSDPPRDEAALQGFLATQLKEVGADIDLWEPEPTGEDRRIVPNLSFEGRPQLAARIRGRGNGPSLLLTGHIDAVPPGPDKDWESDPFTAEIREGRLYGRGAADMKGGIGALVFAVRALAELGIRLEGDIVVCTVTDEETSGAGSLVAVEHGIRADAGICAEPTGFDAWVACRGTMWPVVTVPGRSGHAGMPHPPWQHGGPVNALEKAQIVLNAAASLREDWSRRGDQQHPYLAPSSIVPTMASAGIFPLTYPPSCTIWFDVQYLPTMVDDSGTGASVEREIHEWVNAAAQEDTWLKATGLAWELLGDTVAAEMRGDHPAVQAALSAAHDLDRMGAVGGFNSWHDAAHFTRRGGTPTFSFGPGGMETAHAPNESVAVADLVDCAAAIAVAAMRYCGVARR